MIAENKGLQNTYKGLEQKFKSLENDASDVADGSQKKEEVMRELNECKANLEAIKPVMEEKKIHLEKSLKFHEIVSALNSELQWIQEKDKVVVGTTVYTFFLFYFSLENVENFHVENFHLVFPRKFSVASFKIHIVVVFAEAQKFGSKSKI